MCMQQPMEMDAFGVSLRDNDSKGDKYETQIVLIMISKNQNHSVIITSEAWWAVGGRQTTRWDETTHLSYRSKGSWHLGPSQKYSHTHVPDAQEPWWKQSATVAHELFGTRETGFIVPFS